MTSRSSTALSAGGRSVAVMLIILVIAECVAAFETSMAIQLLYSPGEFFTQDLSLLVWVVTAYSLVGALATGFVGRLGDQFGRSKLLVAVLLLAAFGSVVSAVAPNFGIMVLGRAIQGVSGAVLPLAIGIVRTTFPEAKVSLGIAVVSTSALIAGAGGMLLGGVLLDNATWHWIFWSAAIFAVVAAMLVGVGLPREPKESLAASGSIDYVGGLLFGAATAAVLYGVTLSKNLGFTNASVLAFVGFGVLGLAAWVLWELRVPAPMVDVRMFKERKFSLGMLATALIAAGPIGMTSILSMTIYRTPQQIPLADGGVLQMPVGLGLSATASGLMGFVTAAAAFCISPVIGKVSSRFGARMGLMIGSVLMIIGLLIMVIDPTSITVALTGLFVVTFGTGFLYSGMPTVIVECVRPEQTSTATAVNAVTRTAFQAVAAPAIALMLAFSPVVAGENTFVSMSGFLLVIGVLIALCLLTMLVVFFIPATKPAGRGAAESADRLSYKD